ncbi:MAG: LacI family transcriptional regulator [Alicyclobacillus sp.]|nr:LacI family transcriptional regulator [Alicyclobacillus sp.]
MPATIRDVAKAAGVSITTVSRALNGYPDVGAETRRKILRIAEELNYRPNAVARSLVMKRTQTIGLLVSGFMTNRMGHHFMFEVLRGLHDRLMELGYDMILASTSSARQRVVSYLDFCTERRLAGVVVMGMRLDDPYMHEVVEAPLPSVGIDLPLLSHHCGYVMSDNVYGAKLAVRHLVERGHRRIGFVNGYREAAVSRDRLRGFQEALEACGVEADPDDVWEADFTMEGGAAGLQGLLGRRPDLTAVFFASDLMAIGGLRYAAARGIRVPEQLAIVGYDDIDLVEFTNPPMTTVHQPRYEMGAAAADSLIGMLERGERPQGRVLVPELVVRGTT